MIVDILYELSILCITADGAIQVLGHEWSRACSKSWGKFLIVSVSLNCIEKVYPMHCVGNMRLPGIKTQTCLATFSLFVFAMLP
jgi:hypothetical protein